jgi:hypothetical protein
MRRQPIKGRGAEIFLERNAEENQQTGIPVEQDTSKLANRFTGKPDDHPTSQPSQRLDEKPAELVKATFYLTPEAIDDLDDFWFQLRRKTRRRLRVSKSQIVSHVLEKAIRNLKDEPPEKLVELFK